MGFDRTKDLKLHEYTKYKAEKSWVSSQLKIRIVMNREDKRWGLTDLKLYEYTSEIKICIVKKKAEKRWVLTKLKLWNYMNIHWKRQKNHGFWIVMKKEKKDGV